MNITPPFIGVFPGTPALDQTDECTVIPIRAQAAGSRVSPRLGFRPSAWLETRCSSQ